MYDVDLDEFDIRLICELQDDASQSCRALARKLKTSPTTVSRRIQRLLNDHWIRLTAIPSLKKMGFTTVAFIGIEVKPGSSEAVSSALAAHHRVHLATTTIGRYDVFIWVVVRNSEELNAFLENVLNTIEGVVRTETFLILREIKRTHGWISEQDMEGWMTHDGNEARGAKPGSTEKNAGKKKAIRRPATAGKQ